MSNKDKNYSHQSVNETLLPSFEQKYVTYLPGRVTDVTVALALDKSIPSMMSLKQVQESVAAIIGPNINPDNVKITIVDLHAKDQIAAPVVEEECWLVCENGFLDENYYHNRFYSPRFNSKFIWFKLLKLNRKQRKQSRNRYRPKPWQRV